jgi:hypothetical protein
MIETQAMAYHQLIYTSTPTEQVKEDWLLGILDPAQNNNVRLGISGLLLFHEGKIIQLLEGSTDNVKKLFGSIQQDPRHTNVEIVLETTTDKRAVPSWNMGFSTSYSFDSRITDKSYYFPLDFVTALAKMMSGNVDKTLLALLTHQAE